MKRCGTGVKGLSHRASAIFFFSTEKSRRFRGRECHGNQRIPRNRCRGPRRLRGPRSGPNPRVLILWSGPLHEINDTMRLTMERLTGPFEGSIFTTMPEPRAAPASERFEFLPMKYRPNRRLRVNLAYLADALILTLRKRAEGSPGTWWSLTIRSGTGLVGLVAAQALRRQVRPRGERRLRFLRQLHRPQTQPHYPLQAVGISPHRPFRAQARGRYQGPVPRPGGALQGSPSRARSSPASSLTWTCGRSGIWASVRRCFSSASPSASRAWTYS